jgi:hypothetical protein
MKMQYSWQAALDVRAQGGCRGKEYQLLFTVEAAVCRHLDSF